MDAKKCDLCGHFYTENKVESKYKIKPIQSTRYMDLCDRCRSELNQKVELMQKNKSPDEENTTVSQKSSESQEIKKAKHGRPKKHDVTEMIKKVIEYMDRTNETSVTRSWYKVTGLSFQSIYSAQFKEYCKNNSIDYRKYFRSNAIKNGETKNFKKIPGHKKVYKCPLCMSNNVDSQNQMCEPCESLFNKQYNEAQGDT